MSEKTTTDDEKYCIDYGLSCRAEAKTAKADRMDLNRDNFLMYQLKHDFSHKLAGQSKEVLSKTRNAVESTKSIFQQALADLDDWYRIEARDADSVESMKIKPAEMYKLLNFMLKKADYFSHIGNTVQLGLLGSLSITKVCGELVPKPKFSTRSSGKGKKYEKKVVMTEDKTWELRFKDIRQEDYYPDPTDGKLYRIEECEMDLHVVKALSKGDDAIYEASKVAEIQPFPGHDMQEEKKSAETGQNTPIRSMRPRVKITEFWGTIVDEATGDVKHENCVMTIANDLTLIRKPTDNPCWHQKSPIIDAALIEVAGSVWGIALMDAGTKHNRSLIELFNLLLDSAMKSVWGITQTRVDALEDVSQITGGIRWGLNLKVNSSLPVGGKVMEEVITGDIPQEAIAMWNILTSETQSSMMTSDIRMGGQSQRAVKATEVVASENNITSVFQGMAKNFEGKKVQPELELACWEVCQNWDRIDSEIFKSLFGAARGEELAQMEPQDVFVSTINGLKFEVFGISLALRRQADFRKWTTLMQVISGSETLTEAFVSEYSFQKFLGEVMTALDIDKSKIAAAATPNAPSSPTSAQPGGAPGALPNQVSQQPTPANIPAGGGGLAAAFGAAQMNRPSAQALK